MTAATEASGAGAPLAGLVVLDLSRVLAGPLCAQTLADHGARVIKVEAPEGDQPRRWGPPFDDDGTAAYYTAINRNKENVCLNLSSGDGREVLGRLIAMADVVIENFKAGTMTRWGFDYEGVLAERHPRLVYCRITGFGLDGPLGGLPGYDAVLQAFGGLMSINGEPDGDPLRVGVPIVDLVAANMAVSGILMALLERAGSGLGQLVDLTLLDAVISILHPHSASWLASGVTPVRTGATHPVVGPYQVFHTASGAFFIAASTDRQFATLVDVLGRPDLADDPRFLHNDDRMAHLKVLVDILTDLIGVRDGQALADELIRRGVPASPVQDVGRALDDPQVRHRDLVVDLPGYRAVGVPLKLSRSRSVAPRAPARQGEHTLAVLRELGYDEQSISQLLAGRVAVTAAGRETSGR